MKALEEEIVFEKKEKLGIIRINRPQKLNALTKNITIRLREMLQIWKEDESVSMILFEGAGEKAFSAGGDLLSFLQLVEEEGHEGALEAWKGEYLSGAMIATYPKPIVGYLDGITMGAGAGLATVSHVRIVTENTRWAMPEMKIGLFPDAGLSYFFSRMKSKLGVFLASTGKTIFAEDCCFVGLADVAMSRKYYADFLEELIEFSQEKNLNCSTQAEEKEWRIQRIKEISEQYPLECRKGYLESNEREIQEIFQKETMEKIWKELEKRQSSSDFAAGILEEMKENSPLSMKITFEQLKKSKTISLAECYNMDTVLGLHFLDGKDFFAGVQAVLIDKTRKANWEYSNLEEVPQEVVLSYFA